MNKSFDQDWERIHAERIWGSYPAEHIIRFVARNYYNTQRERVKLLDYGCGGGAHTWYLAREGFDTYAFDGSASAIKRVEEKLRAENLFAHLKAADALELDYPDDFFDAIIDNVCIYSNVLNNIKQMYLKIYQMLKPGGKLITVCFGRQTTGYGTGRELEENTFRDITEGTLADRGITHFFSEDELRETLQTACFDDIEIEYSIYTDNHSTVQLYIAVATKA